jgi:integrase/recombinase XerD
MTEAHDLEPVPTAGAVAVHHAPDDLERWVTGWLASYRSPATRRAYYDDLRAFTGWLASTAGVDDLRRVDRRTVDAYALHLEAGYAPATVARRLAALSSFYRFGQLEHGHDGPNPAERVRRPKLPNYSPRLGLNLSTAPPVIAAAEAAGTEARAVVALCFFAALRVSEALAVTGADIVTEAGHTVVRVTSKGGRADLVPLSPAAVRLLEPAMLAAGDGPLLAGVDRFKARRIVAQLGKAAGLDGLTVHDLRHGAVTCSLEAGEPLHRVQQLARHASPLTTQRYDHSRDRLDASAAYGLARAIASS